VLATTNSTPSSPASIILLTALPPAPPTPNTTMRGLSSVARGAVSEIAMELCVLAKTLSRLATDPPAEALLKDGFTLRPPSLIES
jgi:hypothetical protein